MALTLDGLGGRNTKNMENDLIDITAPVGAGHIKAM